MSEKPSILCTRRMPPNVEARLVRDYDATLNPDDGLYSADGLVAASEGRDGIFCAGGDPMTAEVIGRLPERVGIIATYSVGYEHVAVDAAKTRGIVVTNTPEVLNDATADIAMLCLLGAARRGAEGDRLVRAGEWVRWHSTMMLGVHVTGKRLGIFGMGRIGRAVARRARGFDMEVHYNNRSRLAPELEAGAVWHDTPESLLAVSDFLSINAPSSAQTRNFLNAERIALLPDGAVVVNTARGDLDDDDALIGAPAFRQGGGGRSRRLRRRAESRFSLPGARQHLPPAPHRQRQPRDARRDGVLLPGQPRCVLRGAAVPERAVSSRHRNAVRRDSLPGGTRARRGTAPFRITP